MNTQTVGATIREREMETGGKIRYIETQVHGDFKVGEIVKATIESTGQAK